jgi:cytochrome bd-type quinol oxidase subunit 2
MAEPKAFIALRLAIAVFGGYALSASIVTFSALALSSTSLLPRSEAVVLASMLGFVIYLCVVIWALAERRVARLGLTIALATAALVAAAYGIGLLARSA